jgi:hypothetical protein
MKLRALTGVWRCAIGGALCVAATLGGLDDGRALGQVLFTTQNDFTGWTSDGAFNIVPVASPDLDARVTNGLKSGGGVGTPGSLQLDWNSGAFNNNIRSPGLQGNAALVAALGSSGIFEATYTKPTITGGTYFQLGIVLNYEGHFDQLGFTSEVDNGNGTFTGRVPYTFDTSVLTGGLDYLQIGVLWNSDWQATSNFYVDNIRIVPEPGTLLLTFAGGLGLLMHRRRGR